MRKNISITFWLIIAFCCFLFLFFLRSLPRRLSRVSREGVSSLWVDRLLSHLPSRRAPTRASLREKRESVGEEREVIAVSTVQNLADCQVSEKEAHPESSASSAKEASSPTETSSSSQETRSSSIRVLYLSVSERLSALVHYQPGGVLEDLSMGKLALIVFTFAAIFIVLFIPPGNPVPYSTRAGWIATGFLPLTIALGTKNNLIGVFVGAGYEKVCRSAYLIRE